MGVGSLDLVLDMLNLRCTQNSTWRYQVVVGSRAWNSCLRSLILRVLRVKLLFKAIRLGEVTQGVG